MSAARYAPSAEGTRGFQLTVTPGRGETFGVTVEGTRIERGETQTTPVVATRPVQAGRVIDALFAAVRKAGHQPSVLAFSRKAPIVLGEAEGVRLALLLLATKPISRYERVRSIATGVNAMGVEETYYWYSKCAGPGGSRACKALRTLLAD